MSCRSRRRPIPTALALDRSEHAPFKVSASARTSQTAKTRRCRSTTQGWNDHDRAWGVVGALLTDRAKQQPDEATMPATADHEQIGALCLLEKGGCRPSFNHALLDPHALKRRAEPVDGGSEAALGVHTSLVERLGRRDGPALASVQTGRVLPDSDSLKLPVTKPCFLGREPQRLQRALRPVHPDHDPPHHPASCSRTSPATIARAPCGSLLSDIASARCYD